jgi:hypothetical protein
MDTLPDLPVGLAAALARPAGPWHALRIALYSAEVAGREAILARSDSGRPPRESLQHALQAAAEELVRIGVVLGEMEPTA